MEKFNIKRFWQTFKWLFCENSNRLLVWTLALTLGFFMIESFLVWSMQQVPDDAKLAQQHNDINFQTAAILGALGFCYFMALIAIHFGFSRIFASLKTKQKRIAYLTLPATNAERFVASLLYVLVVFPVCVMIALVLGDTLRMVVYGLTGGGWHNALHYFFKGGDLFIPDFSSWQHFIQWLMEGSIMLWICSMYVLGGTWLRQHAFFIVTATLITLFIVGYTCHSSFMSDYFLITIEKSGAISLHPTIYPIIIIILAAALFNFWWSYKIFTRFQIITSKWTNV